MTCKIRESYQEGQAAVLKGMRPRARRKEGETFPEFIAYRTGAADAQLALKSREKVSQ